MNNRCEESVENLAIALGMLIAAEGRPPERQSAYECFVESTIVLARHAGVERERALQPFDCHREFAADIWEGLDEDPCVGFSD